jgi:hypothetical protein
MRRDKVFASVLLLAAAAWLGRSWWPTGQEGSLSGQRSDSQEPAVGLESRTWTENRPRNPEGGSPIYPEGAVVVAPHGELEMANERVGIDLVERAERAIQVARGVREDLVNQGASAEVLDTIDLQLKNLEKARVNEEKRRDR